MPMTFSDRLRDYALALCWSLWTELGVAGLERRHSGLGIDLEPLIFFTADLADADPRLRDESLDWCVRFGHLVSVVRLRNLIGTGLADPAAFGPYAATVNAHARRRWPGATEAWPYRPSGKSRLSDLRRPALIQLRLRALLGQSARAEVLRLLLAAHPAAQSAADLAPEAGYVKRAVAEALESLCLAGVLEALRVRNQIRYRIVHMAAVLALLGEMPTVSPNWRAVFHLFRELRQYAIATEGLAPLVAAPEVPAALRRIKADLQALRVVGPREAFGADLPPSFEGWALALAEGLASGRLWQPEGMMAATATTR